MKVKCKSSDVQWFREGSIYELRDNHCTDYVGVEWHSRPAEATPGAHIVTSRHGRFVAEMREAK